MGQGLRLAIHADTDGARYAAWLELGEQLMQQAGTEVLACGCHCAWVYTQFGGHGLYERLGNAVFGELPDYPPDFIRSFLRKYLSVPAGADPDLDPR